MQMTKKVLSIVLAVMMVVSMMSVMAVSANAINDVAEVNGTNYGTLADAFTAASTGDTITVLTNVENLDQITVSGKEVTLDLDGNKVSGAAGLFKVLDGASLTVEDGTLESVATNGYAIYVASNNEDGGTFVLESGATIKTTGTGSGAIRGYAKADITVDGMVDAATYGVVVTKSAQLTVNDNATIKGSENAIASNGNSGNGGYTITINGGIIGTANTNTAIYHQNNGTLIINDGFVAGKTAVYVKSGTTTINGGTFTSTKNPGEAYSYNGNGTNSTGDTIVVDNCNYPGGAPTISIEGGTFNVTDTTNAKAVASYSSQGASTVGGFVSGGTFDTPVDADYCANGYIPKSNTDGTYGVKSGSFVAQVGANKYESLADAFTAASTGDTITVLTNIENLDQITVSGKAVTLDLDGNKVSGAAGLFKVLDGASLTVEGGTLESVAADNKYAIYVASNNEDGGTFVLASDATLKTTGTDSGAIRGYAKANITVNGTVDAATYGVVVTKSAQLTVNSPAVIKGGENAIASNGNNGNEGYTITINGGTIGTADTNTAIYHQNAGTLTINGGTVQGKTAVYVKSGTTTINGGTFTSTKNPGEAYSYNGNGTNSTGDTIVVDNCNYPGGAPTISIVGGTFNVTDTTNAKAVASYSSQGASTVGGFVSGGTFSSAVPAEYCAEGYVPADNGNGTYTVAQKDLQDLADEGFDVPKTAGLGFVDSTTLTGINVPAKASILGVQLRQAPENGEYDEGNGTNALRFITAVDKNFLQNQDITDYGYLITVRNTTMFQTCKNTTNTTLTSGADDDFEYFTAAIYNIPDGNDENIKVQFVFKTAGNDQAAFATYKNAGQYEMNTSYADVCEHFNH